MAFTLAGFLMAIIGSLAARVIFSLGIGWISYNGVTYALSEVRGFIESAWSVSTPVLDILLLAGMGHAVGILLSALSVRATLYGFAYLGKMIS